MDVVICPRCITNIQCSVLILLVVYLPLVVLKKLVRYQLSFVVGLVGYKSSLFENLCAGRKMKFSLKNEKFIK